MTRRQQRLCAVFLILLGVGAATALALTALQDNLSYYRTPTDIVNGTYPEKSSGRGFRLGGLVEKGSIERADGTIRFRVTDLANSLPVHYRGVPPDLFRDGQGVVAEGKMSADGVFNAQLLLAKHDEKYMPPPVAAALKPATP